MAILAALLAANALAYYDPRSGKWLTTDPLGEQAGPNTTAFCNNDPVNNIDPLGLLSEDTSLNILSNLASRISEAARLFRVPPRYIAATMYAELRFNAKIVDQIQQSRMLRDYVMQDGIGSIGPAQMKPYVAVDIERFLHNSQSPFYLGKEFETALPLTSPIGTSWKEIDKTARNNLWERLTGPEEVFYVAAQLRMFAVRWQTARERQLQLGVGLEGPTTIANRVDVLATLYNLGFPGFAPKPNPKSNNFGINAMQFYNSDKLLNLLPRGLLPAQTERSDK
jgi:hypothetical protein